MSGPAAYDNPPERLLWTTSYIWVNGGDVADLYDAEDELIELIFTDGGSKVGITDTFESVASVSVEIDGQQYLIKVPVTIGIDTMVPITSSLVTVPSAVRVGQFAVEIQETNQYTETATIGLPGYYEGRGEEFEPSDEDHKIVMVSFAITNVGSEKASIEAYDAQGVDDTGRLFDELKFI